MKCIQISFTDYTVYSLVKVSRSFCRSISPHSSGLKSRPSSACCIPHAGFLCGLLVDPEVGGERNFGGFHSVISQHIELFIAAIVRTSNSYAFL
jgi:hypothetical protein